MHLFFCLTEIEITLLLTKLLWPGDIEGTFWSLSQAATRGAETWGGGDISPPII